MNEAAVRGKLPSSDMCVGEGAIKRRRTQCRVVRPQVLMHRSLFARRNGRASQAKAGSQTLFAFLSSPPPPPPSFAWMFGATRKYSWWGLIRIADLERAMGTFFLLKLKETHIALCWYGWAQGLLGQACPAAGPQPCGFSRGRATSGICVLGALVDDRFQSLVSNALRGTGSLWALVRGDAFPPERKDGACACERDFLHKVVLRQGLLRREPPWEGWFASPAVLHVLCAISFCCRCFGGFQFFLVECNARKCIAVWSLCAATAHAETTFSA